LYLGRPRRRYFLHCVSLGLAALKDLHALALFVTLASSHVPIYRRDKRASVVGAEEWCRCRDLAVWSWSFTPHAGIQERRAFAIAELTKPAVVEIRTAIRVRARSISHINDFFANQAN
jgi:hypothetical protein